ncbi:MAG TPA: UbiA family prenyltransferase [Ktedonobacteraceae bacterium]|nr:UbiA family prenyltransferase [Ktedonobacteraceae bacterium]
MTGAADFRPINSAEQSIQSPPLVVDLDGTLVKTNLLLEAALALLKEKPQYIFVLPVWLLKGKAYLKQQVTRRVSLDVSVLPYREEFLDYLKAQRTEGRSLVLATAGNLQIARQVAEHLKLFDLVFASDGTTNLSGESKRDRLAREFGEKGFDYAGNDRHDLVVWSSARKAIVVNPTRLASSGVASVAQVDRIFIFEDPGKRRVDYLKPLRPQHWLKNLLIFVPLLAAHRFEEIALSGKALLAFLAFGCVASAGYLINDLLDLQADRHHPGKRFRSFASGDLPLSYGLAMIPALVGLGYLIGMLVSPLFLYVLLIYLALSLTFSLHVKKVAVLDVILLAGLYTMRIMAGCAAIAIWPSHWLLAFSIFLFFSLALVKRYGELVIMRTIDGDGAKARGYELSDGELLAAMGTASGYLAVLVLALYISSNTAQVLYGRYELIWFLCPLLLYWISHLWLTAHRGRMPDDPVVFAISDRVSRILMLLMLATTVLAL